MTYLLLLAFLLSTSQILSKPIIINLDKESRPLSKYFDKLEWIPGGDYKEGDPISNPEKIEIETNKPVKLSVSAFDKHGISLSTEMPFFFINLGQKSVNYTLTSKPSDECLLLNFPEINDDSGSGIHCTYTNAPYTFSVEDHTPVGYKKELSVGKYVIGLTYEGTFEVNTIEGKKLEDGESSDFQGLKIAFKQFEGIFIKDFWIGIGTRDAPSNFAILVEGDKVIVFEYKNAESFIEFEEKKHTLSYDGLSGLTKFIFNTNGDRYIILKNGFYILESVGGGFKPYFHSTLTINGKEVELKEIDMIVQYGCAYILIKNQGLVFARFGMYGEVQVVNFFEHKNVIGLAPTAQKHLFDFQVGVLVDNQSNEDVKEFFFELSLNYDGKTFKISRVFISSEKVRHVQTDVGGSVTMFLLGPNTYIVPRTIYGLNILPIYVYKGAKDSQGIGFININMGKTNTILFRLTKGGKESDQVVSFYNKPDDQESFTCVFKEKGDYRIILNKRHVDDVSGQIKRLSTNYPVSVLDPEDKDKKKPTDEDKKKPIEEDKKKPIDEDKKKPIEEDKKKNESNNTVLIVIIVCVLTVVVVGIIGMIWYFRKKRRQQNSSDLIERGLII
jgi:hypothetical protein